MGVKQLSHTQLKDSNRKLYTICRWYRIDHTGIFNWKNTYRKVRVSNCYWEVPPSSAGDPGSLMHWGHGFQQFISIYDISPPNIKSRLLHPCKSNHQPTIIYMIDCDIIYPKGWYIMIDCYIDYIYIYISLDGIWWSKHPTNDGTELL